MTLLDRDLVTGIFLYLPVKSLYRFRCLSKLHYHEIVSPRFVNNHLKRSIYVKPPPKLIIRSLNNDFYAADFDDDLRYAFLLNNPLKSENGCPSVWGSCDGLILLGMDLVNKTMDLTVWNPFTRQSKRLPLCPIQTLRTHIGFMSCGLGYDSAHDDHKVVMISKVHGPNCVHFQVWVYGLKSDLWRKSQDLEDEVNTKKVGHFANGTLYWACENKCVGFDLAKEVFFDIPLPSAAFVSDSFDSLVVFDGNLYFRKLHDRTVEYCLLVSDPSDNGGEVVGVSWRKEFTIGKVREDVGEDVEATREDVEATRENVEIIFDYINRSANNRNNVGIIRDKWDIIFDYFRTMNNVENTTENVEIFLYYFRDWATDFMNKVGRSRENVEIIFHNFPHWAANSMNNAVITLNYYCYLPLGYSKDGDSILIGGRGGVFWHNLENKTDQRVNFASLPDVPCSGYNVCQESLVSVGKDSVFDGVAGVEQFDLQKKKKE